MTTLGIIAIQSWAPLQAISSHNNAETSKFKPPENFNKTIFIINGKVGF